MKPPALVIPIATVAGHAFLAPSSADRWYSCPGSAWMESQFPDLTDPTERAAGECCHWVMFQALAQGAEARTLLGAHDPAGTAVTLPMVEAIETLAEDIERELGPEWRRMIIVEQPLTMKRVHSSACWGTPDVRGWKQRATGQWALYVWDLKFGFKRVEVFENKQLVLYVIGALEEAKINGSADQSTPVVMKVFQPRAYHPDGPMRQWACLASDLRALTNRLMMAAEEATGVAPSCKPNADACENCLARSGCDALQEAAYRGMEITRQTIPRELSPEAAGLELAYLTDAAKLMEARISGLEELVKHQLAQGARVPYWRMGSGRASTEWTKTPQEIATLGRLLGLDLAKPLDVITPLQAKAKGLPESLLPQYSESRPGATKLIREDNASVRRIFTSSAV